MRLVKLKVKPRNLSSSRSSDSRLEWLELVIDAEKKRMDSYPIEAEGRGRKAAYL
jgi:hypothetical protein